MKRTEKRRAPALSPEAETRVKAARKARKEERKARKEGGRKRAEWVALQNLVLPSRGPKAK